MAARASDAAGDDSRRSRRLRSSTQSQELGPASDDAVLASTASVQGQSTAKVEADAPGKAQAKQASEALSAAGLRWNYTPSKALTRSGMFDAEAPCANATIALTACTAHFRGDVSRCEVEQRRYMHCQKSEALGASGEADTNPWSDAAEPTGATGRGGSGSVDSGGDIVVPAASAQDTVDQAEAIIARLTRSLPGASSSSPLRASRGGDDSALHRGDARFVGSSLGGSYADSPTQAAEDAAAMQRELARQAQLEQAAHTLKRSPLLQKLASDIAGLGGPALDQQLLRAVGAKRAEAFAASRAQAEQLAAASRLNRTVGLGVSGPAGLPAVVAVPGLQGGLAGAAADLRRGDTAAEDTRFRGSSKSGAGAVVAADTAACVLHGTCPPAAFKLPPITMPAMPYFLPVAIGPFGINLADAAGMIIGAVIHGVAGPEIIELVQQFINAMMATIPPILRMVLVEGLIPALPPMPRLPDLNAIAARLMAMLGAMKLKAELEIKRILAALKLAQLRLQGMLASLKGLMGKLMLSLKVSLKFAARAVLLVRPMALQLRRGSREIAEAGNRTAAAQMQRAMEEAETQCDAVKAMEGATQAMIDECEEEVSGRKEEARTRYLDAVAKNRDMVAESDGKALAQEARAKAKAEATLREAGVVPEGANDGTVKEVVDSVVRSAEEEGWLTDGEGEADEQPPTASEIKMQRAKISKLQNEALAKLREIEDLQGSAGKARRAWEAVALREQRARQELEVVGEQNRDESAYRAVRSGGWTWRWGGWRDGEGRGLGTGAVPTGNAGSGVEPSEAERALAQKGEQAYATGGTKQASKAGASLLQQRAASGKGAVATAEEAEEAMASAAAPVLLEMAETVKRAMRAKQSGDHARHHRLIREAKQRGSRAVKLARQALDAAEAGANPAMRQPSAASLLQAGAKARTGNQRNGAVADIITTQVVSQVTVSVLKAVTSSWSKVMASSIYDSVTGPVAEKVASGAADALEQGARSAARNAVQNAVTAALERALPPLLRRSVTRSVGETVTSAVTHTLVEVLPSALAASPEEVMCCHLCHFGNETACDCCGESDGPGFGESGSDVPLGVRNGYMPAMQPTVDGAQWGGSWQTALHAVAEAEARDVVETLTSSEAMGAVEKPASPVAFGVGA